MAHYAKVENGVVTEVIVADEDFVSTLEGEWVQTSYNTREGVHCHPNSNEPDGGTPLRKNYAGIGFIYDRERDAFIAPKLFDSWVLNEEKCLWEPPVSHPNDGKNYEWDEDLVQWVEVTNE